MPNVIEKMPLYANIENAPLIKLSPLSLPIDEQPTENSDNLVDSNTIYNLYNTLLDFINNVNANTPVGTIIAYAGNETAETLSTGGLAGYIRCNGAEVSRTTYKELFDVIGTTYGDVQGTATFKLPNLQDNFLMGANGNTINVGTQVSAALPNITGVGGLWTTCGYNKVKTERILHSLSGAMYLYAPSGLPFSRDDFVKEHGGSIETAKQYLSGIPGMTSGVINHIMGNNYYFQAGYTGEAGKRWQHVSPSITDVINNYADVLDSVVVNTETAYLIGENSFPLAFNASLSNPIYGSSETVQPPAVAINFYIKYKLK